MNGVDRGCRLIQYWDHATPPPALLARMERWREQHPGWRYQRYDRASAAALIDADVFRIAALQAEAGVWIDAGTHCLQPLEHWLDRRHPLLLLRRSHQEHPKVWNGFIHSAAPGHPLLVAAWQQIAQTLLARRGERVYRDFGPGVLRDLLAAGAPEAGLRVVPEDELTDYLRIGSSSDVLPGDRHWSQRQQRESLYLSGGRPSASQRSNEAS